MRKLALTLFFLGILGALAIVSGPALVLEDPQKSDAIVVLGGDSNDLRYDRGVELLRAGYGRWLLVNASGSGKSYGQTGAERAQQFIERTAGDLSGRILVCPYYDNSTFSETRYVVECMEKLQARSGLLVTSQYHTRRAHSIFSTLLPQYQWSAAGADDPGAWNPRWWRSRQWAKVHLGEWERMIWWQVVDRWRQ
ncbi:MAG: YdcF family protein [Candidatus Korobacteraceae bacterium]